jgi:acyl-CoA dehydrogenase
MDFNIPKDIADYLVVLDKFIEDEIKPLQAQDDNERFFDHRREWARTDFENEGLPRPEWEALLREAKKRADKAGHLRYALPKEFGGQDGSNLGMAVIREHFARKGLGLHNDLQNEHSIVGNFPQVLMLRDFAPSGPEEDLRRRRWNGKYIACFGLTEPHHGSDATHMETRAVPPQRGWRDGWLINGEKMWITGMHVATHIMLFCRTSGKDGDASGHHLPDHPGA